MKRVLIALLLLFAIPLAAQTPARFDVVSVKPNRSGDDGIRWTFENGRFTGVNVTLKMLISTAYGQPQQPLPDFQIAGGPSWLATDRFDVVAAGAAAGQLPLELRQLVEDRFEVRAHFEVRDEPVYALVLSRKDGTLGPWMRRTDRDCAAIAAGRVEGERCGGQIFPGTVAARGITMTQVISGLARLMPDIGRPVIDRTGLTGMYDIDLTWAPQPMGNPMPGMPFPPVDQKGPSLFTALQEQLGLKLDSQRGPVDVLVVDGAEQPKAD